ncbi:MAG: hypothetical protein EOP34_11920 [Rickettsiales bacterium]|nr:MAG: hypothetical protein EOP34_11920 [Rickettsiales bacterium]
MLTADDKKKLLIAYLDSYISRISNYHNHKETMVNVALLLQLGLFGAIVNKDWSSIQISNIVIIAIFLFFWSIVHIYMKWQLSNKIRSSLYYNGIDQSMRQLILDDNLLIETIKNEDITVPKVITTVVKK